MYISGHRISTSENMNFLKGIFTMQNYYTFPFLNKTNKQPLHPPPHTNTP